MKKLILMASFVLTAQMAIAVPGSGPMQDDACGAPRQFDYVQFVTLAGIRGCGQELSDFTTSLGHASITRINTLQDPNLFYSVLVQDPATGKSLSAVVKCEVNTGGVSLLTLDFAATTSYGGCELRP